MQRTKKNFRGNTHKVSYGRVTLVNTGEMDYPMEEMRKISKRTLASNYKMVIFRLIMKHRASSGENAIWVVGGPGVVSQKIKKSTLNFEVSTDEMVADKSESQFEGLWDDVDASVP
ncbi:hypothetical protein FXO37_24086 [Capsicum annuum]|nr:hypothetical protein FXO37_24086 [Capsicum annuum]